MTDRRAVRVDQSFFDDLDRQLGPERGPNGEPSSTDFIVLDLPAIVEEFACGVETMPLAYPDRTDYRAVVVSGTLVLAAVVVGQILPDGGVVLLGLEIDASWPNEPLD